MKTRLLVMTALLGLNLFAPWAYSDDSATSTTVPSEGNDANSHAPSAPGSDGGGGGDARGGASNQPDWKNMSSDQLWAALADLDSAGKDQVLKELSQEKREEFARNLAGSLQSSDIDPKKFDAAIDAIRAAYPDPSKFFEEPGAPQTPEGKQKIIDALAKKDPDVQEAKKSKDLPKLQKQIDKVTDELAKLKDKEDPKYKLLEAKYKALTAEGGRAFKEVSDAKVDALEKKFPIGATAEQIRAELKKAKDNASAGLSGHHSPKDSAELEGVKAWAAKQLGDQNLDKLEGQAIALRNQVGNSTDPSEAGRQNVAVKEKERQLEAMRALRAELGDSLKPGMGEATGVALDRAVKARTAATAAASDATKAQNERNAQSRTYQEAEAKVTEATAAAKRAVDEKTIATKAEEQARTALAAAEQPVKYAQAKIDELRPDAEKAQQAHLAALREQQAAQAAWDNLSVTDRFNPSARQAARNRLQNAKQNEGKTRKESGDASGNLVMWEDKKSSAEAHPKLKESREAYGTASAALRDKTEAVAAAEEIQKDATTQRNAAKSAMDSTDAKLAEAQKSARVAEVERQRADTQVTTATRTGLLAQSARNYTAEPPVTPTGSTTSSSGNGIGAPGSTGASGDSGTSGSTNPSGTPPPPPIPPPPRDARGNPVVSINGKSLQYLPDQGKYGVQADGGNYYVYNDQTKRVEWTRGTAPTSQTSSRTSTASRLTAGVSGQGGTCGLNGEGCGGSSSLGQQSAGSSFQGGTCGPNGEGCGGGSSSSFRQTRSGTTGWRLLQIVRGRKRR